MPVEPNPLPSKKEICAINISLLLASPYVARKETENLSNATSVKYWFGACVLATPGRKILATSERAWRPHVWFW
jgi:hypothetical protein